MSTSPRNRNLLRITAKAMVFSFGDPTNRDDVAESILVLGRSPGQCYFSGEWNIRVTAKHVCVVDKQRALWFAFPNTANAPGGTYLLARENSSWWRHEMAADPWGFIFAVLTALALVIVLLALLIGPSLYPEAAALPAVNVLLPGDLLGVGQRLQNKDGTAWVEIRHYPCRIIRNGDVLYMDQHVDRCALWWNPERIRIEVRDQERYKMLWHSPKYPLGRGASSVSLTDAGLLRFVHSNGSETTVPIL